MVAELIPILYEVVHNLIPPNFPLPEGGAVGGRVDLCSFTQDWITPKSTIAFTNRL
jgi:hypothetical protein